MDLKNYFPAYPESYIYCVNIIHLVLLQVLLITGYRYGVVQKVSQEN